MAWSIAAATGVDIDGFFFDGSWLQFWMGVALFYALNYGTRAVRGWTMAAFLTVIAISASDPVRLMNPDKNAWETFFVAGTFAAAAFVLSRYDRAINAQRSLSFFRTCGVMCYSLYLVHLPVANLLRAGFHWYGVTPRPIISLLVCVPVSLALAWQFHLRVELRFLNRPLPAARATAAPLMAAPTV
jgi:peptidoglycan/LPS O-acetylase OafA/YrhL